MLFRYLLLITILVLPICAAKTIHAQTRRSGETTPKFEELPCFPVDTIAAPNIDTKITLYSNNTREYSRPGLEIMNEPDIYKQNWDTTQVFSYRSIELADLPTVVELKLINILSDFHYPIKGKVFSRYGPRGRRNHNGVDISLKKGEPIYAAFDGIVRYSRFNSGGFGNLIIIRHQNGLETWYAHLSKKNVMAGDYVKAGDIIGDGGSTGRSRGPHLHFEMRYCDQTFDPEFIIDFESGQIRYQIFALEKSFFNIRSRATDQLEEDDDFETYTFASNGENGELTSEEIIARIKLSQNNRNKSSVKSSNTIYHTIISGDMLGKLARRYSVSVTQICRLNNITETTTLKLGRSLRIR